MSAIDRATLEDIAFDMVIGSMMYLDTPRDEIRHDIAELSDDELVAYITD